MAGWCGNLVILWPCIRCAGVSGSGSVISSGMYVKGLSLYTASTSVTMVCRVGREMCALSNVFLIEAFVRPINFSQYPPNQEALLGINFHSMLFRPTAVLIFSELNSVVSSSAADVYVVALSDIITCNNDLRVAKRRNARRKVDTERSVTTSKWISLDVAQVNGDIDFTFSSIALLYIQGSVKSMPVMVNGAGSCTLSF